MSEDDKHKARLEEAVTRLEEALSEVMKKAAAGTGDGGELARQVQILTAENESLRNELASANDRHEKFRRTTEAVSDRLDATIAGLTKMLDG